MPNHLVSSLLFRQVRTIPQLQIVTRRSTVPRSSPHIRYVASTSLRSKNKVIHPVKDKEAEEEDEARHMANNNNPNPAISLPGGISWPFSGGSSMDAAMTTIIGLGLGDIFFCLK